MGTKIKFPPAGRANDVRAKVLFIRYSALGDIVLSAHIGRGLKELYPNIELTWLVERRFAELGRCMPWFDKTLVWERAGENSGLTRLIRDIRKEKFDVLFNFQCNDRSAFLTLCSGIPWKIGWHRHFQFIYDEDVYAAAAALGIPPYVNAQVKQSLVCPPDLRPAFALPASGSYSHAAVLAIGASLPRKRWPVSAWRCLVQALLERNCLVVLVGSGADEIAMSNEICAGLERENIVNLTGRLALLELIKTLDMAEVVVSGDTGPLHIARALGKKVIALFGPTSLAPAYMNSLDAVLFTSCEKRGCLDYGCTRPCMETIAPESVLSAFDGLVKKRSS